ncbi:MAG TPA: response regulator transcription factor [Miltoncostaeaceae bacterium]|nr:response regulator transcription factor [Miltoncostaeaceae bacterium]
MPHGVGGVVPSVLVVEDDAPTRIFLAENLIADRFAPMSVTSVEEALAALATARPDIALVDVGLPGRSGLDLVSVIRDGGADVAWDSGMPIVLISGDAGPQSAVRAIERGADDFVPKPFHYPELLARLGAALRRSRGALVHETLRVGSLNIDRHARRASVGGRTLALSAKEFALLTALARDPQRVHTKEELLRDVWGYRGAGRTRTVDSHASRLRRKLAACGAGDRWIGNVWGVGYRLFAEEV